MRIVIITQEELFYIPLCLGEILKENKEEIIAIIILPGIPKGFNHFTYIKRLYGIFGIKDFISYGFLLLWYKLINFLAGGTHTKRYYSVKKAARKNSVPVHYFKNINGLESLHLLRKLKPDVIISVAAPQIFKREVINLAKHTINVHGALLPRYQGIMPGFWVLAKGEEITGVTVHFMDEKVDQGRIILQKTIEISPKETLHSMQTKIALVGAKAVIEALEKLKRNEFSAVFPDKKGASYFSFPTKEAAREFGARGRKFL